MTKIETPKKVNKPVGRQQLTKEQRDLRKKATLERLRPEALALLEGFVAKATISELESLIGYVNAKNDAFNNMDIRLNNIKALSLVSSEAVAIMGLLPVIDAVMVQNEVQALKALRAGESIESIVGGYKEVQSRLIDITNKLVPVVDKAVEDGLVRDRKISEEYKNRKNIALEMASFGIDPSAPDAKAQLETKRAVKKAADLKEAEDRRAEKERIKAENLAKDEAAKKANDALLTALGIDPSSPDSRIQLKKIKLEMKKLGIDPSSKDAAKDYKKKRETTGSTEQVEK